MLTSQMIKEAALAAGADRCGIGSMDRFAGAPKEMDPRYECVIHYDIDYYHG